MNAPSIKNRVPLQNGKRTGKQGKEGPLCCSCRRANPVGFTLGKQGGLEPLFACWGNLSPSPFERFLQNRLRSCGAFFTCGVFGYPEATLKETGMYHMMKESAVEKAKNRAVEKLRKAYPSSRLQVWRAVHRMMRRPVLPPGEDSELRRDFPQYVRALAEVYGVLSEAASDMDNISI